MLAASPSAWIGAKLNICVRMREDGSLGIVLSGPKSSVELTTKPRNRTSKSCELVVHEAMRPFVDGEARLHSVPIVARDRKFPLNRVLPNFIRSRATARRAWKSQNHGLRTEFN